MNSGSHHSSQPNVALCTFSLLSTIDKCIHVCPVGIITLETATHLAIEKCAVLLVLYALCQGINLRYIEYAH